MFLCDDCIHKYVCKYEKTYKRYYESQVILTCKDFLKKDEKERIREKAKDLIIKAIRKEL